MNDLVVKANALIEAGHRLSLSEQRIVLSAIAQIRRDEKPDSEQWYTVTANALADVTGLSAKRAYEQLADAVENLWRREIVVRGGPNGAAKTTKKSRVMKTRWVQAVEYVPGEGTVRVMFAAPVVPYLTQLKEQFTKYELKFVAPMRSRFGPRLYELLVQWRQQGEREIAIDDLQSTWGTDYDRVFDLKRRVIESAVKDVNKHSDLDVKVGYRKTGRRVTHVQFRFSPKKPNKPKLTPSKIQALARPHETYNQVQERLINEGYPAKEVRSIIREMQNKPA